MSIQDPTPEDSIDIAVPVTHDPPASPNGWGTPEPGGADRRTIVLEQEAATHTGARTSDQQEIRYRLGRVGPLSVFRVSVLFSLGLVLVALAAVTVLYMFLDGIGVLKNIQHLVNSSGLGRRFHFELAWILAHLLWVGLLMVVAGSLVATCLAVFYNAVREMGGGLDLSFESVDRPGRSPRPTGGHGDGRKSGGRLGSRRPLRVGMVRDDGRGDGGDLPDASGF